MTTISRAPDGRRPLHLPLDISYLSDLPVHRPTPRGVYLAVCHAPRRKQPWRIEVDFWRLPSPTPATWARIGTLAASQGGGLRRGDDVCSSIRVFLFPKEEPALAFARAVGELVAGCSAEDLVPRCPPQPALT